MIRLRVKVFLFSLIALLLVLGATGGVLYATGVLKPKVRDVDLGAEAEKSTKAEYRHVADLCARVDTAGYEKVVPLAGDMEVFAEEARSKDGAGSFVQCAAEFDLDTDATMKTLIINSSVRDTETTAKGDVDAVMESYPDYLWKDVPGRWQHGAVGYGNSRATGVTQIYFAAYDGKAFVEVTLTLLGHVEDEPELATAAVATAVEVMALATEKK